jgi:hypothetical protein
MRGEKGWTEDRGTKERKQNIYSSVTTQWHAISMNIFFFVMSQNRYGAAWECAYRMQHTLLADNTNSVGRWNSLSSTVSIYMKNMLGINLCRDECPNFRGFTRPGQLNGGIIRQISPRLLPSSSFTVHCSLSSDYSTLYCSTSWRYS